MVFLQEEDGLMQQPRDEDSLSAEMADTLWHRNKKETGWSAVQWPEL